MPFTKGDKNAGSKDGVSNNIKNKPARDALNRIITQSDGKELRKVAEAIFAKAQEGDVPAAREIFDRTDGKVVQEVAADVDMNLTVEIIRIPDE